MVIGTGTHIKIVAIRLRQPAAVSWNTASYSPGRCNAACPVYVLAMNQQQSL